MLGIGTLGFCIQTQVLVNKNDIAEGIFVGPAEDLTCSGGPVEGLLCLLCSTICSGCASQVWFEMPGRGGIRRQLAS